MSSKPNWIHQENQEWIDSIDFILKNDGLERAKEIIALLLQKTGLDFQLPSFNTPYLNTLTLGDQPRYPGDIVLEKKIRSLIRWNAMAMVVRANRHEEGIGGHISTYASSATLYEVGFHHFFRAPSQNHPGDFIYFQGHASPGIYGRAFLEGRLSQQNLENFRRENASGGGLSSYPHPRLMPEFWQFPTVSMGLGPLMAIYQARFMRYLMARGLIPQSDAKVWAFLGDGESDEVETTGALSLAARENLDNLIFVMNCNLQRLDGPVRGNGKIIQEMEGIFKGAGWNVLKVIWGRDWDTLLNRDLNGLLLKRMEEAVDGEYQKYASTSGAYIRKHFFGKYPELLDLVKDYSDSQLKNLRRGGHDSEKVYHAYLKATHYRSGPTLILAKTVKGYGLGDAGEAKNVTHQQKKLSEEELLEFRSRFGISISDEEAIHAPFYKPHDQSPEMIYLKQKREALGGSLPQRNNKKVIFDFHQPDLFAEFNEGTGDRAVSTTMVFVRILSKLLKDKKLGPKIVPIIPDEARTFGMEALFSQYGIYSPLGQKYEAVDSESLISYKESKTGQVLEEGINEAGAMSSFIQAACSYVHYSSPCIPFYIFYSMFGFQRVGDLIWAAGDLNARGFLLGATAGRTTLAGEGLQHQDGHSPLLAYPYPSVKVYEPAFAFDLAVMIEKGLEQMTLQNQNVIYYLTVQNENYSMPKRPSHISDEEIMRGLYCIDSQYEEAKIHLFGSGSILNEVLKAKQILKDQHQIIAAVWNVTSYKNLYDDARNADVQNLENPSLKAQSYLEQKLGNLKTPLVFASDYVRALPDSLASWLPSKPICLGTDGYGLSESRSDLREHFKVNAKWIVKAALNAMKRVE